MFTGEVPDRLAIRELIDTYNGAVALRDAVAWGSTWAEDGFWRIGGREVSGRENIVEHWKAAMSLFEEVLFMAFPGSIEIEGDRAAVRTHTYEHLVTVAGPNRIQRGIYEDELVRLDGRWLFSRRTFTSWELKS